jgi:Concanavalin A-like lectin/glucanases superfamily
VQTSLRIAVSVLLLGANSAIATPPLVADYQFQSNLQSSIAGAPDLVLVGAGTAYATETVYFQSQTVLTFSAGSGIALTPVTSILSSSGSYTIALLARITTTSSYRKFIDFDNATADTGLYNNNGFLEFYSYAGGNSTVIGTKYADIVLSRDSSGGLAGYYNGALQFSIDDAANQWGVVDASNTLRFFLDDHVGGGVEDSDGAVARVRLWDGVLNAQEVQELTDPIFADGFEAPI